MNSKLLEIVEMNQMKKDIPDFRSGDSISITSKVIEGDKTRTQTFKGIVIAIKNSGIRKTVTVRKISHGIGVEKIYPLHSPMITKIKVMKKGKVRRAKLYYMRQRVGKSASKIDELIKSEIDPIDSQEISAKSE